MMSVNYLPALLEIGNSNVRILTDQVGVLSVSGFIVQNTHFIRETEEIIDLLLDKIKSVNMNSMKVVIPLRSLYWSIHTKDESKRGTAFAFIFGVN